MAIVVGVNSWITLEEAENFMQDTLFGQGFSTDTLKEKYVIESFNILISFYNTIPVDSTDVNVLNAQKQYIYYLYRNKDIIDKFDSLRYLKNYTIGQISETYREKPDIDLFPKIVLKLLNAYRNKVGICIRQGCCRC